MDRSVLSRKPMTELKDIASHLQMRGYQKLRKAELIDAIISSGETTAAGGDDRQQRLVTPSEEAPASSAESTEARAAREENARKVLPPGVREGNGPATPDAGGAEGGEDEQRHRARTRERPHDTGRTRVRTQGDGRSGGASADADQDADQPEGHADHAGTDRTGSAEGGEGRTRTDSRPDQPRSPADQQTGARQSHDGGAGPGRAGADDDDDEDDDSPAGRKRRNRRDRRKRNRERQGEESVAPQAPSQPSGNEPGEIRAGVLDILPEGYGFLRTTGYLPGERDVYVSQGQIRKHALRRGDVVQGPIRQQRSNEKVPALHHVQRVNGDELDDGQVAERPDFDGLPVIHPEERLSISGPKAPLSARLIDLIAPLGRGQRALVVAPPRAGKSTLLRELGLALAETSPDSHLMAVMIDERPEEVSAMARVMPGEVIASTFDKAAEDHTQIAELAFERARRLVELGHDVIVLLDSVTRLARAYGVTVQGSGRAIGQGVDAASLYPVKRAFAAARNTEGGSLTLVATALCDTGSPADQVILEEFLRVANTVVHLDADLVRQRIHPPVAVLASGTDDESALQDTDDLVIIQSIRRALDGLPADAATVLLLDKLAQTDTNDQLLAQIRESSL